MLGKHKFLRLCKSIVLMKGMLKNTCKAAKIKIVKTTALHHQSKVSHLRPAVNSIPVQEMKNLKYLQNQKKSYDNIFLLILRQHHFINQTIKSLGPTPPFLHLKNRCIFTPSQQIRSSQRPVVACYRDAYTPTSRKYVSNEPQTRSFQKLNNKVSASPLLCLKTCGVFTQILQKRTSQTPVAACFRDTYAPTSRKDNSSDPKTRSFQ